MLHPSATSKAAIVMWQGPVATSVAIIPLLITNVVWGAVAGAIALGVQQLSRLGRAG